MKQQKIIWLDEVDSTNRYALEHFDSLDDGSLVIAKHQTAGRGRRGRSWISPVGENIYASFIVKSAEIPVWHTPRIGGLAALEALRSFAVNADFWLKWPNDLFCGDRKICGILSEVKNGPGNIARGAVIGIGININMPESAFCKIDKPATSLRVECGEKINLKKVVELLAIMLNKYYIIGLDNKHDLYGLWKNENVLLGKAVDILLDDRRIVHGDIVDIGFDGELKVATAEGIKTFLSGDISIDRKSIDKLFK